MARKHTHLLKKALISRLKKAGLDPRDYDISIYDFNSFQTLDDLIKFYAKHGDPLAQQLLNFSKDDDSNIERWAHEYKNYLQSFEGEQNEVQELIKTLEHRIFLLEHNLERLQNNLQNNLLEEKLEQLREELHYIKNKINNLEPPAPSPEAITPPVTPAPAVSMAPEPHRSPPPKQKHKAKTNVNNNVWAKTAFLRAAIVHILGYFISWVIYDITGFSMFLSFLIFIAMAWLDALVWATKTPSYRRGFAAGYLMSQYTNPYKNTRG